MYLNESLIRNYFSYNILKKGPIDSTGFIFDAAYDLGLNPAVSRGYMMGRGSYRPDMRHKCHGNVKDLIALNSLTGLGYSFIQYGFNEQFTMRNDTDYPEHEFGHNNFSDLSKIDINNKKFLFKAHTLMNQVRSLIKYLIKYYSYCLSIDYSLLLTQWEKNYPSLHMQCHKEVKELKAIIEKSKDINKKFKCKYSEFVKFVEDSSSFSDELMSTLHKKSSPIVERNFFGNNNCFESVTKQNISDNLRKAFENQERIFTDFIEVNKDILIPSKVNETFNSVGLIKDYHKVLKICEVLMEKTNIHMEFNEVHAVNFLNQPDSVQSEIIQCHNTESFSYKMNLIAIRSSIKNSNITDAIVFEDGSVVVKKKGYTDFQYSPSSFSGEDLIIDGCVDDINHMLRKNPSVNKAVKILMNNIKSRNPTALHTVFNLLRGLKLGLKSYFDNENILKSHSFDLINELKTSQSFENFDDKIHKIIRKHKIDQYAMSIVSNKYKNLYSDKTLEIMTELYDLGISTHILQDMIGKKMASIKNTRTLNAALRSLLNSLNGFQIENVKMKAAANNAKTLFSSDDYLILEIDNFKQSKALGSPSWCISRDDYHFENYLEGGNFQIFAYDFTLTAKDNKSMVGVTLTRKMKVHAAHSKNDSELRDKAIIEKVIKLVANAKGIDLDTKNIKSKTA
jgi:hypothetical protein